MSFLTGPALTILLENGEAWVPELSTAKRGPGFPAARLCQRLLTADTSEGPSSRNLCRQVWCTRRSAYQAACRDAGLKVEPTGWRLLGPPGLHTGFGGLPFCFAYLFSTKIAVSSIKRFHANIQISYFLLNTRSSLCL